MARACPSAKKSFANYGDALNYLRETRRRNPSTVKLRNVYACDQCSKWHMTSQPRHGHRLRMGKTMHHIPMDDIVSYAHELRSKQVLDPSSLRAPVSQQARLHRMVMASRLGSGNKQNPSPDSNASQGAQNSSSAR